jgi:3-deoxy-D-arabino-heptulosonate 7-phosphate (DAHP) synthase
MIIAGNCLYVDETQKDEIFDTAKSLVNVIDIFRCKIYGGGTTPEKYMKGVGDKGIQLLEDINYKLPTATEIHTPKQIDKCDKLDYLWIGARNSANYTLIDCLEGYSGEIMFKRGFGMTIDETIGLYDIYKERTGKTPYLIMRGINTFD